METPDQRIHFQCFGKMEQENRKSNIGRYGLKSEKFVEQLLSGLWLKEIIRDKRHLEKILCTSTRSRLRMSRKCEYVQYYGSCEI